jgi:hypothetical protein
MRLNVRRGLFRLWLICSVAWVATFSYIGYQEFRAVRDAWHAPSWEVLLPTDCSVARGVQGTDFENHEGHCWYSMPKFRTFFPEYRDLSDDDLANKLYTRLGVLPVDRSGFKELRQAGLIAVGVPLVVLVLGWALIWAISGFRGPLSPGAAPPPSS